MNLEQFDQQPNEVKTLAFFMATFILWRTQQFRSGTVGKKDVATLDEVASLSFSYLCEKLHISVDDTLELVKLMLNG